VDRRRWELARQFGGPRVNPEDEAPATRADLGPAVQPAALAAREPPAPRVSADWPWDEREVQRRQRAPTEWQKSIDLGDGITIDLVRIPAGQFVMGSIDGEADEWPLAAVTIDRDFWISTREITNEQFRRFNPPHCSGYFSKRSVDANGPGIAMDEHRQPVVRVSWQQAIAFCRWLSDETGLEFTLPTEAQWEYACRAGSSNGLNYGHVSTDFSTHANAADAALSRLYTFTGGVVVLQDFAADTRFNDGAIATVRVGCYRPNAWGLYDMHGNAAEWTRSTYRPYPYREDDGRNILTTDGRKVVRGGSFYDRPARCRSAFRLSYPTWQRVHDVGFRVVASAPKDDR
jgi:formylglycine-generating enzyme required for sulfatase activity